jgi:dTDP-4-amino-4,6-dideoxygalactose transaminase
MGHFPLFKVHVDIEAALKGLRTVFDSGFINEGEQVRELQSRLVPILGSSRLVLTNAGTSALTIALRLAGVGPGTNVVATAMTCIASNTPIINLGGDIRWADVDPLSGMVTAESIATRIDGNTKAVIFVDWGGVMPELAEIDTLCRDRGVKLIQDAAHAFMAEYRGRPIANFADYTCFSFQAIKHFTCGDGGALICRTQEDFEVAKRLKWFGFDREKAKDERGNWKGQQADADILEGEVGYKFNMNNVAAAIGLAELPHIADILARHRANAAVYDRVLAKSGFIQPITRPAASKPSFWVYTTVLTDERIERDEFLVRLVELGIHAGQVHVPNDDYTCFNARRCDLPGTRRFASRQFSLPCGWWLSPEDCADIASRVLHLGRQIIAG